MPTQNNMLAGPVKIATTRTTTAVTNTVTITAPGARNAVAVYGILITTSAVPAGAVEAVLSDGTTTLTINLPATIFPAGFVYNFPSNHPWVAAPAVAVTLTTASVGAIICNATLFYMIDTML